MFRFLIIFFLFFGVCTAEASVNITVLPTEGGNNIRFGRLDSNLEVNKEVKIRISSSDGNQYQVFQRMVEPLSNEKGDRLDYRAINTYSVFGSNSQGSLYLQNKENLTAADQLIYSSSGSGDSDSFTVVYQIDPRTLDVSGNLMGKMLYTVRSIGGGTQQTAFLNMYLEAFDSFTVDVAGRRGADRIEVSDSAVAVDEAYVTIEFSGNIGQTVTVYQELEVPPRNEVQQEFDVDYLDFWVQARNGRTEYHSPSAVSRKRVPLYSSMEQDDTIVVYYKLKDTVSEQTAGKFTGKIQFILETDQKTKRYPFDLIVNIEPVFTLDVTLPPEGVRFSKILPNSPPQVNHVEVEVNTNVGKPYIVMQKVASLLTNEEGSTIPEEYFTVKGELLDESSGKIEFSEFSPVPVGEVPIYFSDNRGSAARFTIIYRLRPYQNMVAGDYATSFVFSLGEM